MSSVPVVDQTFACVRCGYDLRTLRDDGACPECGLGVGDSLATDDLGRAPRGWLRRQLIGVWVQFASYLGSAVAIVAEMYRGYVPGLSPRGLMVLRVTPLVGVCVAVWMLTAPRADRAPRRSTLLVRWGFAAMLALAVLLPGVEHAGFKTPLGRRGWTLFFALLVVCWAGLGCIHARIARTLGAPRLATFAWAASLVWSVALVATAAFYVFREFTDRSPFSRAEPWYVGTLLIGGAMVVVSALAVAIAFTRSRARGTLNGSPRSPRGPSRGS